MIVPAHWAEARLRDRFQKRTLTIRRFGWSDESHKAAQDHAEGRVREAMTRAKAGEKVELRERKVPYNGAEGVPIREEILSRHGDAVVTRNIYGARCLNTPDVLFADVDFTIKAAPWLKIAVVGCLLGAAVACILHYRLKFPEGCMAVIVMIMLGLALAHGAARAIVMFSGGVERRARRRVERFVRRNPEWHLRLYRTPAGFRVLAMHRPFDPGEPAVAGFFDAMGTDPIYVKMCTRQRCFRARVSPKPWRVGIQQHLKPRPGVWPIRAERMADRKRWIIEYEHASRGFASCRFVASLGSSTVHPKTELVRVVHDEMSRIDVPLPIA